MSIGIINSLYDKICENENIKKILLNTKNYINYSFIYLYIILILIIIILLITIILLFVIIYFLSKM
jgi:hypothetical protein